MVRVIDASVAIKWFVQEEKHDQALSVLAEILERPSMFAVPELFYFELVHVFYRLLPNPSQVQENLLGTVLTLAMNRFAATPELLKGIRKFQKHGLSGYDASYVALAELLKGKWLTCDNKAHTTIRRFQLSELL